MLLQTRIEDDGGYESVCEVEQVLSLRAVMSTEKVKRCRNRRGVLNKSYLSKRKKNLLLVLKFYGKVAHTAQHHGSHLLLFTGEHSQEHGIMGGPCKCIRSPPLCFLLGSAFAMFASSYSSMSWEEKRSQSKMKYHNETI